MIFVITMVKLLEKLLILIILGFTFFSTVVSINFELVNFNNYSEENQSEFPIKISQDSVGPNITFLKPSENNSVIEKKKYEIIVNVTDENPPTPGNVSIQIYNDTTLLFSAPMNYSSNNLWNFIWNNVSDYKSYLICVIRIWAKDSSPNENISLSSPWYVIILIREQMSSNILMPIIYILIVSLIFALIIAYFNKKALFKTRHKE